MGTPVQVLRVEPEEIIKFNGAFTEVVTTNLKLMNPTDSLIAFKVKTTAPRRYAVRPNSGTLHAGETVLVSVMRQPFDFDPAERVRHKFMIQSVRMNPGQNHNSIWTEADPSTFMDTRLRVQFDDVAPASNRTQETGDQPLDTYEQSMILNSSSNTSVLSSSASTKNSVNDDEFHRVMSENDHLSKELVSLRKESKILRDKIVSYEKEGSSKLPEGIGLICHKKTNLLIIIIFLILSFAAGVYLSYDLLLLLDTQPKKN